MKTTMMMETTTDTVSQDQYTTEPGQQPGLRLIGAMFNVKHPESTIPEPWNTQIRQLVGGELPDEAPGLLVRYVQWLEEEAVAAGAVGPDEMARVWPRHVLDSLTFAVLLPSGPACGLDIGSGAGLPGIPLAVIRPELEMALVDRSGRRCRLLRRAVRILGLGNVEVIEGDVDAVAGTFDQIVLRASLPPDQAFSRIRRLLAAGGVAVVGLSRRSAPAANTLESLAATSGLRAEMKVVGADVLDSPAWLLRMTSRDHLS